ncbi:holo-ACP synthase, partial [Bacillus velezensis]|nr:holo-ACP synthase [Bacillus velezensis]
MIYGIGIDLIEIERIKNLQNQTKFIERILTI